MSQPAEPTSDSAAEEAPKPEVRPRRAVGKLRGAIPTWQAVLLSGLCIALVFGLWWLLTWGEVSEERIISRVKLPSPAETFAQAKSLFTERKVDINTLVSLKRVVLGFALAIVVGVPLGVVAGCFPRASARFWRR